MIDVAEKHVRANGLEHHVIEWNRGAPKAPFVLMHGFLDFAWSFRDVAELIAAAGHPVIAFDWRGHGESEWVGRGGYYHFPDYVLDFEELLPELVGPRRFHLVAHSMGGSAAVLWTPLHLDRVLSLTLAEGLGPDAHPIDLAPDRIKHWIEGVQRTRARVIKPLASYDEALVRMRVQNPDLPEELGHFLVRKGTRPAPEGGGLVWTFDPLHRTTSPTPFRREVFDTFLRRLTTPTLLLRGERGYRPSDDAERAALVVNRVEVEIAEAAHMMHWTHPKQFASHVLAFAETHDA